MTYSDEKFISYALNLAKKHIGATNSNPSVGCVIVKDKTIIATAVTAIGGRPHAEAIAINSIKNKELLNGAEIFVTLEPCCHYGQTSPCTDEIIKHKFKRVIIAKKDDDVRVNGNGIKALQDAGIEVVCNILENKAHQLNKAFFKTRQTGLPFVTLKIASSLDGKIATKNFDSKWISNSQSRRFAHYLRSTHDAILVGANTIKYDNPKLDCRIAGLEKFSPKKIIISNNCDFNFNAEIFQRELIILCCEPPKIPVLEHIKIISCKTKDGKINLHNALQKLQQESINSILVEGGKTTATTFLKENLVDELIWIKSNKIIGSDGLAAIGEMNVEKISDALESFKLKDVKIFGDNVVEKWGQTP